VRSTSSTPLAQAREERAGEGRLHNVYVTPDNKYA